jgi:chaperone modulatory protein CbpM
MPLQIIDASLMQPVEYLSMAEVSHLCQLAQDEVRELMDYGALQSDMVVGNEIFFATQRVQSLKVACTQRRDYDLDLFSVALLIGYLQEIDRLKQQISVYQALSRSAPH